MTHSTRSRRCELFGKCRLGAALLAVMASLIVGAGCRQKMADQPSYRPLTGSDLFPDGRASRPLPKGVIHRGQALETDPLMTGLTREEWAAYYKHAAETEDGITPRVDSLAMNADQLTEANRKIAFGSPRYDPPDFTPEPGQPAQPGPPIYVNEFPFTMTREDLVRGQERYTIYCAVCHGPLGNGQGKIWERGYLTPTSFHTRKVGKDEIDVPSPRDLPLGYSRGYGLWGIRIPMREVPVGYYFEVITKGYGGMPSYSAQIPPEDRWRIIAYIRVLQFSLQADVSLLPESTLNLVNTGGGK